MNKIKLHLGCSHRYLRGYIHVDKDKGEHIDYNVNINDLNMFSDDSVDEIYTCGTFEYFDREEAPTVLKEWLRVLKTNGILRVSVPDFESIIKVYLKNGKDVDKRGILGPLFGKWPIVNASDKDMILYHKTVYDFKSLVRMLSDAGFYDIKNYDCWKFLPEDFDDYSKAYMPHMDKNGIQMCLNIFCKKI
tara:strand:- start:888 stop:1457 length:570 start_codon:yes stop_codon:yes gene_type:complete